ncbi:MAG: single-stranded DNA-binding protein [Desulfuromonas sp.]|uniref:single-stranded DNA-binding protein n=1 Tax=Desulfuromonas sp. TaxID=892 RepID=UPI000CAE4497|nr:single-stranded DNA-binding protein [Desulfuromonas sp.]PLX86276.1 MAG: single-stranded DNA-binding protein [Desulfuromonas sp.]
MSVNKVILVGNLGKDPELRYTPSGAAVANFSLATSERYKDRNGEQQEKTEWHNIVVWRNLAEICGKYLHKGKHIYIEGRIQTRSYDDRDGNKRYITEIVADKMQMLGRVGDEGGYAQRGEPRQSRPAQQTPAQGNQGNQGGAPAYEDIADSSYNPDDDIPF